jgi:Tat protein translocase TatB subunit
VGFELLLIMVIALVVLGPAKLPKLAADIGRWTGRARAMARQLRSQLDQEIQAEEFLRTQSAPSATPAPPATHTDAAQAPPTVTPTTTPTIHLTTEHPHTPQADSGATVQPTSIPAAAPTVTGEASRDH